MRKTPIEAHARAVNAEPWEPLPGMTKERCVTCEYWFAVPIVWVAACEEQARYCQDCWIVWYAARLKKGRGV